MTVKEHADLLYKMVLIREFENAVAEYKDKKLIYGSAHCYNGEEAVAVGICSALKDEDYLVSNHRPHGHALAKGMDPKKIMAEIFGKETGSNEGKGGSMHIQDPSVGLLLSSGIVGSGIPVGCGAAFAAKYKNEDRISCVFFGDGSANEGVLHECLNYASSWALPVLFVLEDNSLAITTNTRVTSSCNDYVKLASAYGIEGEHVDGQDVEAVNDVADNAVRYIRNNGRPFFIQAHTIRFSEHAEGAYYRRMIEKNYRDYDELDRDKKEKDPVELYISKLMHEEVLTEAEIKEIQTRAANAVQESVEYALNSPDPDITNVNTNVYSEVTA